MQVLYMLRHNVFLCQHAIIAFSPDPPTISCASHEMSLSTHGHVDASLLSHDGAILHYIARSPGYRREYALSADADEAQSMRRF